jgi:hypothetical protein
MVAGQAQGVQTENRTMVKSATVSPERLIEVVARAYGSSNAARQSALATSTKFGRLKSFLTIALAIWVWTGRHSPLSKPEQGAF